MIKKWTLLSATDVTPGKWYPIEKRRYELPNGKIIDDFLVDKLNDVALVVPVTKEGKVIICRQFKPGIGEITYEFPAGRKEEKHVDMADVAKSELREEAGATAGELRFIGQLYERPTKSSERIHIFVATNVQIDSEQDFDITEDIEALFLSSQEIDTLVLKNQIRGSASVGAWYMAKLKFPELFL